MGTSASPAGRRAWAEAPRVACVSRPGWLQVPTWRTQAGIQLETLGNSRQCSRPRAGCRSLLGASPPLLQYRAYGEMGSGAWQMSHVGRCHSSSEACRPSHPLPLVLGCWAVRRRRRRACGRLERDDPRDCALPSRSHPPGPCCSARFRAVLRPSHRAGRSALSNFPPAAPHNSRPGSACASQRCHRGDVGRCSVL